MHCFGGGVVATLRQKDKLSEAGERMESGLSCIGERTQN